MGKKTQIILFSTLFCFIAIIIAWEIFSKIQIDNKIVELNNQIKAVATFSKKLDDAVQALDRKISSVSGDTSVAYGGVNYLRDGLGKLTTDCNDLSRRLSKVEAGVPRWDGAASYVQEAFFR